MKKSYFFKFFVFAVIAAFVTVTSCKDYDDDISNLENQIAGLSTTLNEVKTKVDGGAVITKVESTATGLKITLSNGQYYDLTNGKDGVAGAAGKDGSVVTANADGFWYIDGKKTENSWKGKDGIYFEPNADGYWYKVEGEVKTKTDNLWLVPGVITAVVNEAGDVTFANVKSGEGKTSITFSMRRINEMITKISLDYEDDDYDMRDRVLDFSTATARKTWTFGEKFEGAIKFTTGERNLNAEQTIEIKVSPATADITNMVDKIYLIRRDANNDVNDYIRAVKAERSKTLRAAGPTVTGLWNVTFQMPADAKTEDLDKVVKDKDGAFKFAVAIENSVEITDTPVAERFVISDFGVYIETSDKTPIYNNKNEVNLAFSVKKGTEPPTAYKKHTTIKNRYLTSETGAVAPADQRWETGVWTKEEETTDDSADDRRLKSLFGVELGKTFNVKLDNPGDVYAYYIVLDRKWAVESSPSELNAWNSYDIEGVDKVYSAAETANLKINSAAANGDIIGFRVVVVNYDGTLVDPDGKSFYVYVGEVASSGLNFTQTIKAPVAAGGTVLSDALVFAPGVTLANVTSATFEMKIGHNETLGMANLEMIDKDGNPTSTWANVKKLQIKDVKPSDLEENKTYEGTLTLKNDLGVAISVTTVTLKKVLPPSISGIDYKSEILHNGVIYAYPLKSEMKYNLWNALNGIDAGNVANFVVKNSDKDLTKLTWSTTIGTLEDVTLISNDEIYDLILSKNYGKVLFDKDVPAGKDYLVAWAPTPTLKIQFRSYAQDFTDWKYKIDNDKKVLTPALKYGETLDYSVENINTLPPFGAGINLTQSLPDVDRTYKIIEVKVLTGADYKIVNEYFTPSLVGNPVTGIKFTAVSGSTQPSKAVSTKLQLTLEDEFGHKHTFIIPQAFDMVIN